MMISYRNIFFNLDPDNNHYFECYEDQYSHSCQYISISEYNARIGQKNSGLTLLNYNIRSFNRNFSSFISLFEDLNTTPEILVLSETWLNENSLAEVQYFNAYHTYRTDSRSGGVSIYIKDFLTTRLLANLSFCTSSIEVCTVEVCIENLILFVVAIYRPHSDSVENFISDLCDILNDRQLRNGNVILTGDFNVNLLDNSPTTTMFINTMRSFYMLPLISQPTRFSPINNSSPSLLDHIWTNKPIVSSESGIINVDLTDHCPTFYYIPIFTQSRQTLDKVKVVFRLANDESNESFSEELASFEWNVFRESDPDFSIDIFLDKINYLYRKHFPLKIKHISVRRALNPWMNDKLKKLIEFKSLYFNLMKLGIVSVSENNLFKNKVTSLIKKCKVRYYQQKFHNCVSNLRKTWSLINQIISPNRKKSNMIKLLVGGELVEDERTVAEIFRSHFSEIASSLRSNILQSNLCAASLVPISSSSFFLYPVTQDECSRIVRSLNNTKTDIDQLPVKIFKLHIDSISPILCKLINNCFIAGIFPSILKIATIVPIFKKGNPQLAENYRPVSILPYLSKVFEKCLYNRLFSFFLNNNIFSDQQFEFLPRRSTVEALSNFMEYQYNALNKNNYSIAVFIDFSKAFDTIDHEIFIDKLERYGVRGLPLQLIRSYLKDRTYRIRVRNVLSSEYICNIGTPQGSVLAPLFFLIYINDMPKFLENTHAILFADDTTLCFNNDCLNSAISMCNIELNRFANWCSANKLTINIDKTYYMLITNRFVPETVAEIKLKDQVLNCTESHKFLGVYIDQKLKFKHHVTAISNKISKSVGIMFRLSPYISCTALLNVYYSLVNSYLMYCNTIWGGTYESHLYPLTILQKRCIRIVHGASFQAHSLPLFTSSNVLQVKGVHLYSLSCFIYKNYHLFSSNIPTNIYQLRRNLLAANFQRLNICQRSIYFAGIILWNSIPLQIKRLRNTLFLRNI